MIRRAARLIASLGGAQDSDSELATVGETLKGSGADLSAIADALVGAIEECAPRASEPSRTWAPMTALGACFGAVGGALGLHAIAHALLPGSSFAWLLPLIALPIALFALLSALLDARGRRADQRERAATSIGLALMKIDVPPRLALEVGVVVAALDDDRARHLMAFQGDRGIAALLAIRKSGLYLDVARTRPSQRFAPGIAAVWAVACFWILYFGTITAVMSKGLGE